MKRTLLAASIFIPTVIFSQVTLGQKDDFEDYTTRNWAKNNSLSNTNVYDGGPLGAGDNFLRINSSGTGSNLNLMTKNNAQWTGNYTQNNGANKITYISMDVRNSGSNVVFLRLSFRYTGSGGSPLETWSTTNPIAVLPGAGWKSINFPIDQASVVRVTGLNPYSTCFQSVQEMRILHSDVPNWEGQAIDTVLDIDNIMARNSPYLGVADSKADKNPVKIVPNPAQDYFKIDGLNKKAEVMIFSLSGELIKKKIIESNEKIDIRELVSGNYFVEIKTLDENTIYNQKLIVTK